RFEPLIVLRTLLSPSCFTHLRRPLMMNWKSGMAAIVIVLLAAGVLLLSNHGLVQGQDGGKSGAIPKYTVVETQGHNLLVTDNSTNTIYFYTPDKDAPIGSPLKLRASLDLTKVGEAELKIKDYRTQK